MAFVRLRRSCAVVIWLWLGLCSLASAQNQPPRQTPSIAELEAASATIGEIRVLPQEIFDTADPREDKLLFRWANALHIRTRPEVIRRALLFQSGEPVSVRLIEETERLLRSERFLYDVVLRPVNYRDGVVDIEVLTRDTWSLDLGVSVGRSGGTNSSSLRLKEYNFLGTGATISLGRSKNVDRSGTEFQFSNSRVFGTWTAVDLSHTINSDGRRDALSVVRPFYALDSRWAAGVTASRDDRIDAVYSAGKIASQYRHRESQGEVFAGWSPGLVDGWVQRYSLGPELSGRRLRTSGRLGRAGETAVRSEADCAIRPVCADRGPLRPATEPQPDRSARILRARSGVDNATRLGNHRPRLEP